MAPATRATAETLGSLFGKVRIKKQSPDIAGAVHVGKDEKDVGAGDRFGYVSAGGCGMTAGRR